MYDYVDGKVDWMAYGLAVEGDDGPFVAQAVTDAVTVDVSASVGQARDRLQANGSDTAVVTHAGGWVVGEVDSEILGRSDGESSLLEVMRPVPSTVRPSATVSSLAGSGRERVVVTTSDGRLLGTAVVEAEGHHHDGDDDDHRHDDHDDHDEGSSHLHRMERELTEVMEAVAVHFGDREPSDDELRSFLRDRLVAEGRSEEEADQFMAEIDDQNSG